MSDSSNDQKRSEIPSWQIKSSAIPPQDSSPPTPDEPASGPPNESTLETARKFLEDEKVRDATTEEKTSFLKSKGLQENTIQELLGSSRDEDTRTLGVNGPTTKAISSPTPIKAADTAPQITPPGRSIVSPPYPQTRDVPPIVTYPEFLTTPQKPAPIITAQRLLTTLYLFGGISALIYGTSTYIVAPLVESMTESRHSLASTAHTNLSKLISKLEGVVSTLPTETSQQQQQQQQQPTVERYQDDSESDSDPTELFHRDIGVQTSLPNTPSQSRPSSPAPSESKIPAVDVQTSRLQVLTTHLKDVSKNSTQEGEDHKDLSTTIDVVREYVQSLAFSQPTYTYGKYNRPGEDKDEEDEISRIKASIRGVKGVLLSARSFPSSAGRTR